MGVRAVTFTLALVSVSLVAFACSPPLPAKAAPGCDAGEEAVPVSEPLGSTSAESTRWHCEPRCTPPSQRMTSFIGELGGVKAYEFTCVAPCPLGKRLLRSQQDLDTTSNFTYACEAIAAPPPPPLMPVADSPTEAEDARRDQQLAAQRFAEFRKEREEEARSLEATCGEPCAPRVRACFRDPRASGKTCVAALNECREECSAPHAARASRTSGLTP